MKPKQKRKAKQKTHLTPVCPIASLAVLDRFDNRTTNKAKKKGEQTPMMTDKKRITIEIQSDWWVATWEGPEADSIRELFGTATIPTPFRARTDPEEVRKAIAARNPGYLVTTMQEKVGPSNG